MVDTCSNCLTKFAERDLQLSHDVPKYSGGTDKDGRHWLCKRCHDIYERLVFAAMVNSRNEKEKEEMRDVARRFAKRYFS